jgi:hypothetical protein
MPLASRSRIVTLTKWFPPNDPLASKIARLCILREDFHLEMTGVYTEGIKELDGLSEEWRRLYFFRNLVRTLREIEGGIQRLHSDPEFKILLASQKPEIQREFEEHAALMSESIQIVNDVRNDICGHVRESVVQETLNEIAGSEAFGFLEMGLTMRRTYLKFAGELVVEILVRGTPEADRHRAFIEKMEKIGNLLYAFALIERALSIYMKDRRLLPRRL